MLIELAKAEYLPIDPCWEKDAAFGQFVQELGAALNAGRHWVDAPPLLLKALAAWPGLSSGQAAWRTPPVIPSAQLSELLDITVRSVAARSVSSWLVKVVRDHGEGRSARLRAWLENLRVDAMAVYLPGALQLRQLVERELFDAPREERGGWFDLLDEVLRRSDGAADWLVPEGLHDTP
jgi:hypothetical protein